MTAPGPLCLTSRNPRCLIAHKIRISIWIASVALSLQGSSMGWGQTASFSGAQTTVATTGLSSPLGVAVDNAGNLYVADSANNRVLKETPSASGYTQSVVATGLLGPTGLAVDSSGNVYIADTQNNRVLRETLNAGTYTQAIVDSTLSGPSGVAVDSAGNVYATDTLNNRAVKETLSNGAYTQSVIATGFTGPAGITVDTSGNVFIVDVGPGRVVKETPSAGAYTQTTAFAQLTKYAGIALDASGNLYLVASGNNTVLKLTPQTPGYYSYAYSSTPLASVGLSNPWGVAVDASGNIYTADSTNNRVVELMSTGHFGAVNVGSSSSTLSLIFTFSSGGSIATPYVSTMGVSGLDFSDVGTGSCTANGTTYSYGVGDSCTLDVAFTPRQPGARYGGAVIQNGSGTAITTAYLQAIGDGPQLAYSGTSSQLPQSSSGVIAVDAAGNIYFDVPAIDNGGSSPYDIVYKDSWNGSSYIQSTVATGFTSISSIAIDGAGCIWIVDHGSNKANPIFKATPSSNGYVISQPFSSGNVYTQPNAVAVDGNGSVYVTDAKYGLSKESYAAGTFTRTTIAIAGLNLDVGYLSVDPSGNIFTFNENQAGDLLELSPSNGGYVATTFPQTGGVGAVADGLGNIYVPCGTDDNYVCKLTAGLSGYSSSIVTPYIPFPIGLIALDGSGNIYSSTAFGHLFKVDTSDPPSLIFAATNVGSTSSDSPQTVTVTNNGNVPLIFPIPASGNNPGITTNFTLSSNGSTACPLLNASSFSPGILAPGASCALPISYSPTAASTVSGSLVLTDNALNSLSPTYASQTISLGVTGNLVTPSVQWATPNAIVYGTPVSATQLNATSAVPGTFAYTPAAGTVLGAGTQSLSVTLTPTNTSQYTTAAATTTIQVTQAKPVINWATPASIIYGTALSATQLNATANVAGTFTYTPIVGTLLGAGTQTLSVTFTPTDGTDYTSASSSVTLTVNPATPTLTWPTPAAITYGTALGGTQLDATSSVAGTFTYNPSSGTVLTGGLHTLSVSFTPADATDYTPAAAYVSITVNKAAPTITWANPAAITYGTPLSNTQLNATASVPGYFVYSPSAGSVPLAGTDTLSATFYPYDQTDYTTLTQTTALSVNQATPTITWATPGAIAYGTALSSAQLNATTSVPGALVYAPALGAVPTTGTNTLSVSFTPTDTRDYTSATQSVSLTVNKATPVITWATPTAIAYGTALSAAQLNATASTAGTFTYTPALSTVLKAGLQALSVTFTPTDMVDYVATTGSTSFTVNKAPLAVTASSAARVFGVQNPTFTGSVSGAVNGDILTESFTTTATTASIVGIYPIVPAVAGTNLANYVVTPTNGSLTVSQAGTGTTFALSNQNLTLTATVISLTSGTPTGSVGFYEGQTLVGTGPLSNGVATYTASSFPSGNVVVSAQYSGDPDFTESSSPPIFLLALSPTSTSLSVSRGGSVSDALGVSVAPGYVGSLQFTCSGLPADSTCTFQPSSVAFNGTTTTANVTVTMTTDTTVATSAPPIFVGSRQVTALAALLWAPTLLLAGYAARRRKVALSFRGLVMLLLFCGLASILTACASSSTGTPQTPVGSSTVQVIATSTNGLTQSTNLTLAVQ